MSAFPKNHTPANKGKGKCYAFILSHIDYQGENCLPWPFARDKHGRGMLGVNGRNWWAHRLMCTLAHGAPPTPKHTAAHNCGKGHEGCINQKHLEWKTQKENLADCAEHGTAVRSRYGPCGKLKAHEAQQIRESRGIKTQGALAEMFGVSEGAINDIWRGRTHARPSKIAIWTADEEGKLRDAIARGLSFREASGYIGTKSISSVSTKTYRLGLKSGRPPNPRTYDPPHAS